MTYESKMIRSWRSNLLSYLSLFRRRDFLIYLCHRVEEEWNDGSAIDYLDKVLAGDKTAVEVGVSVLTLGNIPEHYLSSPLVLRQPRR